MERAASPWARTYAAAGGLGLLVAVLGAAATELSPWYRSLRRPPWQPPDWVFAPAWSTIFALTSAAGATAWRRTPDPAERARLLGLFGLNAGLNVGWSALFFRLKRPDWALAETAPFLGSILALMGAAGRRSATAGALLAPYLAWVIFATALNRAIVRRNGPF